MLISPVQSNNTLQFPTLSLYPYSWFVRLFTCWQVGMCAALATAVSTSER